MDQKTWLWKKKSTEKALVSDQANNSLNMSDKDLSELLQVQGLLTEKGELERDLTILSDKLSAALSECNSKDTFAKKQVKIAREAIAGWEKAENEALAFKKDLDKVLQQKLVTEERANELDSALKDCMQQLNYVRDDQERRIQVAVVKALEEFDRIELSLEQRVADAGKKIAQLDSENSQLKKALSAKDRMTQELSEHGTRAEAELGALTSRMDSTEKENASLKYEVRVLEKELEIRSEEAEFNLRASDAAEKKYKESVQKIANLESECQRLRLLVRKRLPGPAALTKMKNEVEMLDREHAKPRRRKNTSLWDSMDYRPDAIADTLSKRINFLTEQLNAMEEENKSLRSALTKRASEQHVPRNMYARAASRLSRSESQADESIKSVVQEHSVIASSDIGSDDKASCAGSWASALISELENFKNEKMMATPAHGNMGTSEMYLMDDFAEMEKLAIVSVEYQPRSSHYSSEEGSLLNGPTGSPSGHDSRLSEPVVPVTKSAATSGAPGMLDDVLKMLLDHCKEQGISPYKALENIKVSLGHYGLYTDAPKGNESINHVNAYSNSDGLDTRNNDNLISESSVNISIHKVINLLEGITCAISESTSKDGEFLPGEYIQKPSGYFVRVFQWRADDLSAILQQTVEMCNSLLNGGVDLEQFADMVSSTLDWIINHCFSLQDVSSIGKAIEVDLERDESKCESKVVDSDSPNPSAKHNSLQHNSEGLTENFEIKSEVTSQSKGDQIQVTTSNDEDFESDLKSITSKEAPQHVGKASKNQLRTDQEITAASEKLAECQETILNLEKKFKALASPNDATLFNQVIVSTAADNVITSPPFSHRNGNHRSSLLDNMLADDNNVVRTSMEPSSKLGDDPNDDNDHEGRNAAVASMAIVPVKKHGSKNFLKKLFRWHKRAKSKKTPFS